MAVLLVHRVVKQRARLVAYRATHIEEFRGYKAVYRAAHPEKKCADDAVYRIAHREELRRRSAAYYAAHREERVAYSIAYLRAHPERDRDHDHRRRVRLRLGLIERVDPKAIYERDQGRCHICGKHVKRPDASMDHLVPISRGGAHAPWNVRLAHRQCNTRRNNRGPAQLFLPDLEGR